MFSAGIRPRDALARECDLEVAPRGGVLVDEQCRTADPHVFAIGECAAPGGTMYGLVAPGYAMAEVVVDALLDGPGTFTGADMSTKLKLLGIDVASFGDAFATTDGALELTYADAVAGVYKKLVVSDDGRRLLGGILVGDASAYGVLRPMVSSGLALPDNPEQLILPASSGVQLGMPDEAQVCSCNDVTKADILHAVTEQGCETVADVKQCTRAGSTCGSCVATVKNVIEDHFASVGKVVDKGLCEHFRLTRQELFDVVAVHGYRRFDDIVAAHGTGRGCDVCKPAIASILASQTSTHILEPATAELQDTNDAYLANLQRNGTYSVVPRIPGGEITPDKLIVIGEVARDYGLYTKITGGQRIDLFGARMEQLPAIWRRLVDAGFESGHAYGKSLRTVKSCVGSTWCRFGVQDSVGLAIALELRYRGLRSPHKLKGGVSGCARECAEARGKDFGVIATEKGWNLYVGGNGGATPAHARLLAGDLSTETLVSYLDRFLMYYVRTADRLQRTSTWIDQLDGGLDRVRVRRRRRLARSRCGARGGDGAPRRRLRGRVARDARGPGQARPVRDVRQRAGHPRPVHRLHDRARPDPADRPGPHPGGSTRMTTAAISLTPVCAVDAIPLEGGVAALVDGSAVAVFRSFDGSVFALSNVDPFSGASVLSRGIVGTRGDVPVVSSPMYKQAFDLRTGACLDDAAVRVTSYDVAVVDGVVHVGPAREVA